MVKSSQGFRSRAANVGRQSSRRSAMTVVAEVLPHSLSLMSAALPSAGVCRAVLPFDPPDHPEQVSHGVVPLDRVAKRQVFVHLVGVAAAMP